MTETHDEFIRSYVDLKSATESVLYGREFLVLGPKGTGKSALAWYLKETESKDTHLADVRLRPWSVRRIRVLPTAV